MSPSTSNLLFSNPGEAVSFISPSGQHLSQAGEALAKIHEGDLWKAGGHKSWDDYCRSVAGISRVHAFRLMKASQCLSELKTLPIGNFLPVSESQLRPLLKLESTEQRAAAWTKAAELAEDRQPTALDVKEAVIEILPPDDGAEKPETSNQLRRQVVDKLRTAIRRGAGPDRLERWTSTPTWKNTTGTAPIRDVV